MNKFSLRIYEADNQFYLGDAVSMIVPTIDGFYGVQANHHNVVIAVQAGEIKFKVSEEDEEWKTAFVSDGMMRIEDNDVLILIDSAEWPEEIDINRAREKEIAAREAMLQKKSLREFALAESSLKRAVARLRIKGDDGFGI